MKKVFGIALLALPLVAASAQATGCTSISIQSSGHPYSIHGGCSFHIQGGPGPASPQAGPWYLYWPLEAHFVAPAPTGYPYWPGPMGLPPGSFGGPAYPPGVAVAPAPGYAPPPAAVVPAPAPTAPAPTAPAPVLAPPAAPTAPQLAVPPYLQPTGFVPVGYTGQAPSYWYDH